MTAPLDRAAVVAALSAQLRGARSSPGSSPRPKHSAAAARAPAGPTRNSCTTWCSATSWCWPCCRWCGSSDGCRFRSTAVSLDCSNCRNRAVRRRQLLGVQRRRPVFNRRRMAAKLRRVTSALERRLRRETDLGLARRMYFPTRWDPFFKETMTLADVYAYPVAHFDFHAAQLSLERDAGAAAGPPKIKRKLLIRGAGFPRLPPSKLESVGAEIDRLTQRLLRSAYPPITHSGAFLCPDVHPWTSRTPIPPQGTCRIPLRGTG